jgi:hypothetical protein
MLALFCCFFSLSLLLLFSFHLVSSAVFRDTTLTLLLLLLLFLLAPSTSAVEVPESYGRMRSSKGKDKNGKWQNKRN